MQNRTEHPSRDESTREQKLARRRLLALLSRRPLTIHEARERLQRAGYSLQVVDPLIEEAKDSGWLDDQAFAKLWVEDRLAHKPRGKALLRRELHTKGVSQSESQEAVEAAEIDEAALAQQLLEQLKTRYRHDDPASRKRKLQGFLARRGFSFEAIKQAMKGIEKDDKTL